MSTSKKVASDTDSSINQISRNGLFSDDQIVQAAAAANDAMRAVHANYVAGRVNLTVTDVEGNLRPTMFARKFIESLLQNTPARGPAIKADSLTDEKIAAAVTAGFAMSSIALTFTDKNGVEKPTVVIDDFLRHLLPKAQ